MNNEPINPLQAMVDGMSAAWQKGRSKTQMTLGGLIKALEAIDPEQQIVGLGEPISYRGYYSDLSFEPDGGVTTVAQALKDAGACMGRVFEGYKGGDFQMGEMTPIWSAFYSSSGPRIMGLNLTANPISLIVAPEEN